MDTNINFNYWSLINSIATVISLLIATIALYFTKFNKAKLIVGKIVDLGALLVNTENKEPRILFAINLSLHNFGSRPAWINNLILYLQDTNKIIKAHCVLLCSPEKFDYRTNTSEYLKITYPILIKANSDISLTFIFAAEKKEDIVRDIIYNANLEVFYNDNRINSNFLFKIPIPEYDIYAKRTGENLVTKIYHFAANGSERKYFNIQL